MQTLGLAHACPPPFGPHSVPRLDSEPQTKNVLPLSLTGLHWFRLSAVRQLPVLASNPASGLQAM
jgi:hypothetical protein